VTRVLSRIGLGILAVVGLCVTVFLGVVLAGFIIGFASNYRSSSTASSAASPGITVERYALCDAVHPSPRCVELAKRAPVATAR
jgi:hypothetical protein